MERQFSGKSFRKWWTTFRGSPLVPFGTKFAKCPYHLRESFRGSQASTMAEKMSRFEEKLQGMERQFDLLNVEIEEWRAKYAHLEEEKEKLFEEVKKELSSPAEK